MFRYNPAANYQPNGGRYFQILSGKDLYKQTIVVSAMTHDTFPTRFPNIFVDYPLGQMGVGDNKINDLILNLTPENVTKHSKIVTTTHKGSSTPTKMSKIIGRQIH